MADVYEGALRNVLNIQLHLSLDDQQSFAHDAFGELLHEKPSPGSRSGAREHIKGRNENHQYGRRREDSRDASVGSFQGRTFLRDPRQVSPGGSAFHVPPKRPRFEEGMAYRRGGFPMERYGVAPPPDFSLEYSNSFPPTLRSPGMYRRPVNASDALTHVHGTNGMHVASRRDHLALWSLGHHRDIPALFPLRCASAERDRMYPHGALEEERGRLQAYSHLNGFVNSKAEAYDKIDKEAIVKEETRQQNSSTLRKEAGLERSKPNTAPTAPSISLNNDAFDSRMETRYRSALRRLEPRREGRRGQGEDGKQEEFLYQLGLERIPN